MTNRLEALVDLKFIKQAFIDGNLLVIHCEYEGRGRRIFELRV